MVLFGFIHINDVYNHIKINLPLSSHLETMYPDTPEGSKTNARTTETVLDA